MKVVYVHGAGRQENRALLKRRLDGHLFGANQLERTILAYYSDVLHLEPDIEAGLEAVGRAETAANSDAVAIADAFEARAIEVAAAEPPAAVTGKAAGAEEMPDPAFLFLARIASADVIAYLIGGKAEAVRAPVRDAILSAGSPTVVIAHSLGTIVTFDVLSELGAAGPAVPLFVTVGSPLGISNVQRRIVGGTPPPPAIPVRVERWANVADPFDPVAVVRDLSPRFAPTGTITDHSVDNRAFLNHDLTGYLDTDLVRSLVHDVVGAIPVG